MHTCVPGPGHPVVDRRHGATATPTPLLVNTAGSWDKRPQARTQLPNLFLAGDYVQTDIDLATMEGANESGRAAAEALLDAAGSSAEAPQMYKLYDPPEFEAVKRADEVLYDLGPPERPGRGLTRVAERFDAVVVGVPLCGVGHRDRAGAGGPVGGGDGPRPVSLGHAVHPPAVPRRGGRAAARSARSSGSRGWARRG